MNEYVASLTFKSLSCISSQNTCDMPLMPLSSFLNRVPVHKDEVTKCEKNRHPRTQLAMQTLIYTQAKMYLCIHKHEKSYKSKTLSNFTTRNV